MKKIVSLCVIVCLLAVSLISAYGGGGGGVFVPIPKYGVCSSELAHKTVKCGDIVETNSVIDSIQIYCNNNGGYIDLYSIDSQCYSRPDDLKGLGIFKYFVIDSNIKKYDRIEVILKLPKDYTYQIKHEINNKWINEKLKYKSSENEYDYYSLTLLSLSKFAIIRSMNFNMNTESINIVKEKNNTKATIIKQDIEQKQEYSDIGTDVQDIKTNNKTNNVFIFIIGLTIIVSLLVFAFIINLKRKKAKIKNENTK